MDYSLAEITTLLLILMIPILLGTTHFILTNWYAHRLEARYKNLKKINWHEDHRAQIAPGDGPNPPAYKTVMKNPTFGLYVSMIHAARNYLKLGRNQRDAIRMLSSQTSLSPEQVQHLAEIANSPRS